MIADRTIDELLPALAAVADVRAVTALEYKGDRAVRIYSSDAQVFADSGSKLFADAPTMARVRESGTPVLTEGAPALRNGFADAQSILDLGADAIVNLPVRADTGKIVGQVNLMGRAGSFGADALVALQGIADSFFHCFQSTDTKKGTPCG